MTLPWSLPCLVLLGAIGAGADWRWWVTPALVLFVHDLTHILARALTRRAIARPLPDHTAALVALLVATAGATAAWQWQAGHTSLQTGMLDGTGIAIAPVLPWLLPALLLGAPTPGTQPLLRRHAGFALCCLVAALAASRHESVGPWPQFLLACVSASLLAHLYPQSLRTRLGHAAPSSTQACLSHVPGDQPQHAPFPGADETTSPR